jgi:hypothetical protein
MNGKTLLSKLVAPSKLASNLNWRKSSGASILTVNIHTDRIGLRVGYHPSTGLPSQSLDDLPLTRRQTTDQQHSGEKKMKIGGKLSNATHQQLSEIIQRHNVCGLVVNWPIQHDTGRLGYAAGRVLWTLEQLIDSTAQNRPVCLWDGQHVPLSDSETDEWGRNPKLGHSMSDASYDGGATNKVHAASVQQYHEDEMIVAKQIWDDFVKTQWPDIYQYTADNDNDHHHDDGHDGQQLIAA